MTIKNHIILILTIFLVSCTFSSNIFNTTNQPFDTKLASLKVSDSNGSVDYLVITTQNFEPILENLTKWKTQKGIISKIEVINDINQEYSGASLTEKIKNCIISYHNDNNTQWVLLAGDYNHVPTQYILCNDGYPYDGDYVCCDSYYGDIDNDWSSNDFDFNAEVYVGRLTANNQLEMQNLVERILDYEKNPPIGPWMSHALFAGSILQFDQDWNNNSIVDYGECDGNRFNNYVNNNLIPEN